MKPNSGPRPWANGGGEYVDVFPTVAARAGRTSEVFASRLGSVPMLETGKLIAFAATTRPERARAFYEGTLGLTVLSDDPYAIALDANGTHLRIQKVRDFEPLPFTALGWQVIDISATVDALRVRGVTFQTFPGLSQDARGIWSAPSGARVAWFRDPDGNTLSLTQI